MNKKILYWAPCLNKVGTYYSTINSAISIEKYSKGTFKPVVINVCGEWNDSEDLLKNNNVEVVKLYQKNFFKYLPKNGFIRSRFSYFAIAILSIIPLVKLLNKNRNEILIIHLIVSLPLLLKFIFNLKIKTILRISGFPKLNFFRKKLWSMSEKRIFKITCPTEDLKLSLIENKIFSKNKVTKLSDPAINLKEFIKKKNDKNLELLKKEGDNFFIAAGRLTKQKNFIYLIKEFKKFLNVHPNEKLFIFGEGELKKKILDEIKNNNMSNNVNLLGYTDNIYKYMLRSKAFILSSLWEDPGFVMIESALCNSFIISSDCKNGPREFLLNGAAGSLFKSNCKDELFKKLINFKDLKEIDIFKKKLLAKKNSKNFTVFRHYCALKYILEDN